MVTKIDDNMNKKLEEQLIEQIDLGFELLKDYKETAKGFVKAENNAITDTGIIFKNTNSLTSKKEQLHEMLQKLKASFVATKNHTKRIFYEGFTKLDKRIKKIIDIENEFIKYKREKRIEKKQILENIEILMAQLETILGKKKYRELLERINKEKYEIEGKVYQLKHILGHLRAGQDSNSVNNKALRYMNLQILLQKEKNMVQGIKEIRTARFAEYKEKKKEKQKEYFKKSLEDLKKIILKINKIYEKKLVGANVPKDIYETIKILKMQTFIDDKDKIKFEKLVKQYNSLVSKLEKLQVSL
jgi:hypothetical protein